MLPEMPLWKSFLEDARGRQHAMLLVSNGYSDPYGRYDCMYGANAKQVFSDPQSLEGHKGLAFGHVGYHYKNEVFKSQSPTRSQVYPSATEWPNFYFFEPEEYCLIGRDGTVEANFQPPLREHFPRKTDAQQVLWRGSETRDTYLNKITEIQECIRNGVFYEMNFCQSFEADVAVDPYALFAMLNETSPAPFASFYKLGTTYLIGGSPERFLHKSGKVLTSQPIKGTSRRTGHHDESERLALMESEKDRAENIMIVDLVRNDLSRICEVGTVKVNELCGIYSYPRVHQMVSTISGELTPETPFSDILEALFPMGSMTGAPKIEVMKHIDRLEAFQRQVYSGCLGYWKNGDFDFNVVIRSLEVFPNNVRYAVGGAITYDSVPLEEWNECLLKAEGLRRLF
jgi:para-aminobenzoate synthetase component I